MRRPPTRRGWGAAVALLALSTACSTARKAPAPPVTWVKDVKPLFAAQCTSCHAGDTPAGSYALDTYEHALGGGSDATPNLIAGDGTSLLLTKLASGDHATYLAADAPTRAKRLAMLTQWVVADKLGYFESFFHPPGILNPQDTDFHGRRVAREGWTMASCRNCHGAAYDGGQFGEQASCLRCHASTPEACNTCHGTTADGWPPPGPLFSAGGAHESHQHADEGFLGVSCTDCHQVPKRFDDPVHIHPDAKARVTFSGLALARGATPSFDASTGQCVNVACHGFGLTGGTLTSPSWNSGDAAGKCGACHGTPPPFMPDGVTLHPQSTECQICHATAGPGMTIARPELHNDGIIEVRANTDSCSGCHAGPSDPVPFRDPDGNTDPSLMTVGAHDAHLSEGAARVAATCDICHTVPAKVGDPGHLDATKDQLVHLTGVAAAGGLDPTFDPTTGTCQNVWCHGAGLPGGPTTSPVWNDPKAQVVCGTCHGTPPKLKMDGSPHPQATTCGGCHGQVIDDNFHWVDKSKHIDGIVEVGQ